jgi:hypothetical protein
MELPPSLSTLRDDRIRRFAAYWLSRGGPGRFPAFRDLDPTDIPWALPWIWVHTWDTAAGDFRCRLVGEEVATQYDRPMRHRLLGEVMSAEAYCKVGPRLRACLEGPLIFHIRGPVYLDRSLFTVGERIVLPLAEDNATPSGLVGLTVTDTSWRADDGLPPREERQTFLDARTLSAVPAPAIAAPGAPAPRR